MESWKPVKYRFRQNFTSTNLGRPIDVGSEVFWAVSWTNHSRPMECRVYDERCPNSDFDVWAGAHDFLACRRRMRVADLAQLESVRDPYMRRCKDYAVFPSGAIIVYFDLIAYCVRQGSSRGPQRASHWRWQAQFRWLFGPCLRMERIGQFVASCLVNVPVCCVANERMALMPSRATGGVLMSLHRPTARLYGEDWE